MTNLQIRREAVRFAEQLAARKEFPDPEAAWYCWSGAHDVSGPAARHLFEQTFDVRIARLAKALLGKRHMRPWRRFALAW